MKRVHLRTVTDVVFQCFFAQTLPLSEFSLWHFLKIFSDKLLHEEISLQQYQRILIPFSFHATDLWFSDGFLMFSGGIERPVARDRLRPALL